MPDDTLIKIADVLEEVRLEEPFFYLQIQIKFVIGGATYGLPEVGGPSKCVRGIQHETLMIT